MLDKKLSEIKKIITDMGSALSGTHKAIPLIISFFGFVGYFIFLLEVGNREFSIINIIILGVLLCGIVLSMIHLLTGSIKKTPIIIMTYLMLIGGFMILSKGLLINIKIVEIVAKNTGCYYGSKISGQPDNFCKRIFYNSNSGGIQRTTRGKLGGIAGTVLLCFELMLIIYAAKKYHESKFK